MKHGQALRRDGGHRVGEGFFSAPTPLPPARSRSFHHLNLSDDIRAARWSGVESDAAETTVAEVALAHGFWELVRSAVQYRQTFGEQPSATLRQPKRDPRPAPSNPLPL